MFKRPEDIKTLLFLAVISAVFYGFAFVDFEILFFPPQILSLSLLLLIANVINHNVMHTEVSSSPWINRFFDIWISCLQGHPMHRIYIPHNLNHHTFYQDQRDWMHYRIAGSGYGYQRFFKYIISSLTLPKFDKRSPPLSAVPEKINRRVRIEKIFILLQGAGLLLLNWKMALLVIFPSQLIAICLLMGINLLQHDQCELADVHNHSRNFTGKFFNWIFFNNGFHAAHHLYPVKHWADLDQVHSKEVAPFNDPKMNQPKVHSFVKFFLKSAN